MTKDIFRQYQVQKADLSVLRKVEGELPVPDKGQALLKIDRAAFTANNISYAVTGDQLGYWQFFPALNEADKWGVIPVWGFADVISENDSGLKKGERLYGYFPMASHLLVTPGAVSARKFTDVMPHRTKLPAIYNDYMRLAEDTSYDPSREDQRAILFPLVGTSFGLFDWLEQGGSQAANTIVLTSASSKTSLGLAALLKQRSDLTVVGVTSPGNVKPTAEIGFYHKLLPYDAVNELRQELVVIVDMAGSGEILAKLHRHYADNMLWTATVGATHHEDGPRHPDILRDRTKFFFMPSHAALRQKESAGQFLKDMLKFSRNFAEDSERWMEIVEGDITDIYTKVRDGKLSPRQGAIIEL